MKKILITSVIGIAILVGIIIVITPALTVTSTTPSAKVKENLVVSIARDPGSPLNIYATSDNAFDPLVELVYDKLFAPSPYLEQPQPWLAESATTIDNSTWIVKLKSGIKCHDGKAFTAQDVQFTFEYFRDGPPNRHTHHVSQGPRIEKIVAEDNQTVRFECGYPYPTLDIITFADLPILPKHIWEGISEPRTNTNLPVGTGPYKLVQYVPGGDLRFAANESLYQ